MQLFFNHYILLLPNFQITYRSQNSNNVLILNRLSNTSGASDIFEFFDSCDVGITFFITGSYSENIPEKNETWLYCPGIALKRGNNQGSIILFGYNSNKIAVASRSSAGWTDWGIK